VVPIEPKVTDKKFVVELSSENIEALALEIIGGNGQTIKFQDIYEYSHFLGKGGFGYVVSAIHRETDRPVALKVRNSGESDRICRLWTHLTRVL
jgi:serine/threonine protein kinase